MFRKKEIKALSLNNVHHKSPIHPMASVLDAIKTKSMIFPPINVHTVKGVMNMILLVILVSLKASITIQQDKTTMVKFLQIILKLVLVPLLNHISMEKNVLNASYLDFLILMKNLVNIVKMV